jgi:hypothetical protein
MYNVLTNAIIIELGQAIKKISWIQNE